MIRTKIVSITPKELFKVFLIRFVKHRWWMFVWLWGLALLMGFQETYDFFTWFFMIFSILYPLLVVVQLWTFVHSRENRNIYLDRVFEIDTDKINGIMDTESYSLMKLEHFIKTDFIRNAYLLYLSKSQFVYIPAAAFETEEDRRWFDNEIIAKIKGKRKS